MRKYPILITVALLLSGWSATAGIPLTRAQETISKLGAKEPLKSSVWGMFAVNMQGDTIVNVNCRQKMVPASNVKLLTTGLALRQFGPDFRFETKIGYDGVVKDSTLTGDLYIIGGGDPTTGSMAEHAEKVNATFSKWAGLIRAAGISRIDGRVIADPRFFDDATAENQAWSIEDIGTYYGAGPRGLNFYENVQNFYVTPGPSIGSKPVVKPRYPSTPWMKVSVAATTSKSRTASSLYYVASDFEPVGQIRGCFPIDRKGYTMECTNRFGPFTCAFYFYNYLMGAGLEVTQGYGDIDGDGFIRTDISVLGRGASAPKVKDLTIIGSSSSAPLSDIIRDTNTESDNFYAETLLRMLGKTLHHSAVYDSCRVAAEDMFKAMGLLTKNSCQMYDGSGLARKNFVSPIFFVSFLRIMANSPVYEPYFNSLPQPGGKGTLEYILRNEAKALKGRVHAKTGSMNGVRCISGYVAASDGDPEKTIVFSLMLNNFTVSYSLTTPIVEDVLMALLAEN